MKDVNHKLEQAMYGKPVINPEERNHYLGQLKERLLLCATFKNCRDQKFINNIDNFLKQKEGNLYINNQLPDIFKNQLMQICLKYNRSFTLVTTNKEVTDNTVILVYGLDIATHVDHCDYCELFKNEDLCDQKNDKQNTKTPFWQKIFKSK